MLSKRAGAAGPDIARDVRGPGLIGRLHVRSGAKHIQRTVSERRIAADPAAASHLELQLD